MSSLRTRKTRIVCISDTHNQTPKLPPGDVLIHAGDLTNQGSESELRKTVDWLEKQEFEVKIVIAGNHDLTLSPDFYNSHAHQFKWSHPQDPVTCRALLTSSDSITYLENTSQVITLTSPTGPRTRFTVFGSPCTPSKSQSSRSWAFEYEATEARSLWDGIPQGTDVVVTHTPPRGVCDGTGEGVEGKGCRALRDRLGIVKPKLSVCGHVHGGRGVERIVWQSKAEDGVEEQRYGNDDEADQHQHEQVERIDCWKDPGEGNKKLSLVDLTTKGMVGQKGGAQWSTVAGRSLYQNLQPDADRKLDTGLHNKVVQPDAQESQPGGGGLGELQPLSGGPNLTSSSTISGAANIGASHPEGGALDSSQVESDIRLPVSTRTQDGDPAGQRLETVVVNAAILGARQAGKSVSGSNKPIVVDLELPVWEEGVDGDGTY